MNKFAATIGNFDGVHLGHQELIGKIKQTASKNNLKTKVITFNPYPFEFFQWEKKRILSEFDKNNLLNKLGIDEIKSVKFDENVRYEIDMKKIMSPGGTTVGLANGIVLADDKKIYSAESLKVGLFK